MADEMKPEDNKGLTAANSGSDDVRSRAVAAAEEMDALTPTPTQEELDRAKLGSAADGAKSGAYKTRQTRAN